MDFLSALGAFVRVAETGSFSAVARERGVTQPAISRQIAALEEHLGARLVQRTTRNIGLTEEGRDFLGPAQTVLHSIDAAESAVGTRHAGIGGGVRIGASVVFGRVFIAPRLPILLQRYPGLTIDLVIDDPSRDLVHDGIDLAIRLGTLAVDSSYVVRRLGDISEIVVAAPGYLAAHPPLRHPADLADHQCILDDRAAQRDLWHLQGPDGPADIHVTGRFSTDSSDATRAAVLAGLGLVTLSVWVMRDDISDGRLVPVLPAWRCAPVPLHAIYPSRRNLAPRLRVVLDFLIDQLDDNAAFNGTAQP